MPPIDPVPHSVMRSRLQAAAYQRGIDYYQSNPDMVAALQEAGAWDEFVEKFEVIYTGSDFYYMGDVLYLFAVVDQTPQVLRS